MSADDILREQIAQVLYDAYEDGFGPSDTWEKLLGRIAEPGYDVEGAHAEIRDDYLGMADMLIAAGLAVTL